MQLTTSPPARVAERIATLDLLSGGRVEFGTGESASITELEPFGITMENKRAVWEDGLRAVIPMFATAAASMMGPISRCRIGTCCRSRCRSHIRRCG
jgi:alkanesulfonate monooxygenase SsuD/methylene tetrahydromethanopterin reductase-like flavin-dependent oxidoreductase (luciferase family)